ncbi:MAG: hypothetical protein ACI857_002173 [Arenicella sp.]|jgi:hypothetical protein
MAQFDQKEAFRKAAERAQQLKEKEAKEEEEHYQKITSGNGWMYFKIGMVFSVIFLLVTTIDTFFEGETVKLENAEWKVDHEWRSSTHQIIKVSGAQFMVSYQDWSGFIFNSFQMTYSPILHEEKVLWFMQDPYSASGADLDPVRRYGLRTRSVFNWFPYLQIILLMPLFTFLFKRKKQWFVFTRMMSMVLIYPGSLLLLLWILF